MNGLSHLLIICNSKIRYNLIECYIKTTKKVIKKCLIIYNA